MEPKRILVVEDEPLLGLALRRALQCRLDSTCEVELSPLAADALQRVQDGPVALLVTDLCMPGMDGLELIERVRQLSPNTQAMLITAFGSDTVQDRAQELSVTYLPKPFRLREFIQLVRRLVGDTDDGAGTQNADGPAQAPTA